jgi:hypothetical protein
VRPFVLTKRERGQCLSIGHALKTSVATMRSFEMISRYSPRKATSNPVFAFIHMDVE